MKKRAVSLIAILILGSMVLAKPVAAANPFQQITTSILSTFERAYLQWVPGKKSGEQVLRQTMQVLPNISSARSSSDVLATVFKDSQQIASAHIQAKGPVQFHANGENGQSHQDLKILADFSLQGTTLGTSTDLKYANNMMYFKFNQLPTVPNFDLSQLINVWYKTELSPVEKSADTMANNSIELSQAFMRMVQKIKAGDAVPDTKSGQSAYKIDVVLPESAAEEYLNQVIDIQSAQKTDQQAQVTAALKEGMRKNLAKIGDLKATLWIAKSSFYPIQLDTKLELPVNPSDFGSSTSSGPLSALSQVNKAEVSLSLMMEDFNAQYAFEEPKDAEDASQMLMKTFGKMAKPSSTDFQSTSEVPSLTPLQKKQLQQLNSLSPEQRQSYMDAMKKLSLPVEPAGAQ